MSSNQYKCTRCLIEFPSLFYREKHRDEFHGVMQYKCGFCQFKFVRKSEVKAHFMENHYYFNQHKERARALMKNNEHIQKLGKTSKEERKEEQRQMKENARKRKMDEEETLKLAKNSNLPPPKRSGPWYCSVVPSTSENVIKVDCCSRDTQLKYSDWTRQCSLGHCKIHPGDHYMCPPKKGDDDELEEYCIPCWTNQEDKDKRDWVKKVNTNDAVEEILRCSECNLYWHRSCSMSTKTRLFKCVYCRFGPTCRTVAASQNCPYSMFMEERMSTFLGTGFGRNNGLSVVNFCRRQNAEVQDMVPAILLQEFLAKHGKSMEYVERATYIFQRRDKVDVIFFIMFTNEYQDHLGVKYCLIDYLDTVPFFNSGDRKNIKRSDVHQELVLSYFDYMRNIGYRKAHYHANAPNQGEDYIINCHPETQSYLSQKNLEGWYETMMKKGKKTGIFKKWMNFERFKKEVERNLQNKKGVTFSPLDIPLFHGGLWQKIMMEVIEEIRNKVEQTEESKENATEKRSKKTKIQKTETEKQLFLTKFNERYDQHKEDNYWIDLAPPKSPMDPKFLPYKTWCNTHQVLGDQSDFMDMCAEEKLEFSSLDRAKFSSMAIISKINSGSRKEKL